MKRNTTPAPVRNRGRPKGTGKNDAARLASIVAMLSADRDLKPTTAIKRAGVTDPSAIRRLREKLRAGQAPRQQVAALAAARPQTVTAELPPPAKPTAPPPMAENVVATGKHPPLAAETEKRTREALLLAAYLEAMAKAPPPTAYDQDALQQQPWRAASSRPAAQAPDGASSPPDVPPSPQAKAETQVPPPAQQAQSDSQAKPQAGPHAPPQAGFSFPGMPPFLQPFLPSQPPQPSASPTQQLEGMKLAVEAMTSMTKLQLHITENAFAYSPLAMMLQGQAMVGQMLLASFTGQLDAMKPKKPK